MIASLGMYDFGPLAAANDRLWAGVRDGHRMEGSGLFIVNPPYGLAGELAALTTRFARLSKLGAKP